MILTWTLIVYDPRTSSCPPPPTPRTGSSVPSRSTQRELFFPTVASTPSRIEYPSSDEPITSSSTSWTWHQYFRANIPFIAYNYKILVSLVGTIVNFTHMYSVCSFCSFSSPSLPASLFIQVISFFASGSYYSLKLAALAVLQSSFFLDSSFLEKSEGQKPLSRRMRGPTSHPPP